MSSNEQSNKSAPANQDHPFAPPFVAYNPQAFNGATYATPPPPGAYPPPFFAYPPPDPNHAENGQNGVPPPAPPYMMAFPPPPPGMVYAFPPPQGQVPPGAPVQPPPALTKPKRKQVKMACTNCAAACKRCDESRPCERCQKYGIGESCQDGQRKERKKGIKRGPYKRKNKNGEPEWSPGAQAVPSSSNAIHAVPQYPSPEGYYGPIYYPTPGTFLTHPPPHEVAPGQEGAVAPNGQPPIMPYFLPAYPPYAAPYGHPAMYPGPMQQAQQQAQAQQLQVVQPQQTIQQVANSTVEASAIADSSSTKKKKEDSPANGAAENAVASGSGSGATTFSKKRTRGKGGESRAKKAKTSRNGKDKEGEGPGDGGVPVVST